MEVFLFLCLIVLFIVVIYSAINKEESGIDVELSSTSEINNNDYDSVSSDEFIEMEKEKILNGFAVTGFILGILSALGFYEFFAIMPMLAIMFSVLGLDRINLRDEKGKGIAITGLVLGIVYTIAFFIKIIIRAIFLTR